jgi:type I restriction enzyme S subunit
VAQIKKDTSLRKAILQAAITGQLIFSCHSELDSESTETGKELLDKIIEERNKKLLAEWEEAKKTNPKAKKPVPVVASEIDEDEIPFEIPENWCWCRLGDVAEIKSSKRVFEKDYVLDGVPFFRSAEIGDLQQNKALKTELFISEKHFNEIKNKYGVPQQGDLLITSVGTIGNTWISDGREFYYKDGNITQISKNEFIIPKYFRLFIDSPIFTMQVFDTVAGTAYNALTIIKLKKLIFPLPPLSVQNAIVAKLEQVLPLVDAYENALLQKEELKTALPDKVKKAILQEAITGKLTEAWRKSATIKESGKQLLDRIIEERNAKALAEWEEALKKNPKAKKPVVVVASEIEEEEIPFEVPESWCWCRIDDLFAHNSGKALNKSENKVGTELEYITTSNLYWNYFELDNLKTMLFKDEEIEKCTVKKGDLLVCEGGEVGRSAIWNYDRTVCIQNHIHRLRAYDSKLNILFYYHVMYLFKVSKVIDNYAKGIGIKGLSSNALGSIIVPLPPLIEQEEIVKKLEELLPLCK